MDKLTANLVALAIACATLIAVLCITTTLSLNSKEVAILTITAIFSAISFGTGGYVLGKKEGEKDKTEKQQTIERESMAMLRKIKKKRQEYYDRWKACWCGPVRERLEAYRELKQVDQLINVLDGEG